MLRGTDKLFKRKVHGFPVLPGQGNHFISACRRAANTKAAIAFGNETPRDWMEDFGEDGITNRGRAGVLNEWQCKPLSHNW